MSRDVLRNGDVISGAVLAALGAYVLFESREWGYYAEDGPGPAFFPAGYGIGLLVLSLALILSAARKGGRDEYDWSAIGRGIATWIAFAASVALMSWLGFLVSFVLLTFFMITVIFRQSPAAAGAVALCGAAGFYLVFPFALNVPLPTGVFGF